MSKLPLDIVNFNDKFKIELDNAIIIANGIQNEFSFSMVPPDIAKKFQFLNFDEIDTDDFLPKALKIKNSLKGFYPYVYFFSTSPISGGGWGNLFAESDLENGISIITTNNVSDKIIPEKKITSYFIYYFARGILKFILKDLLNHDTPSLNGCLFDFMEEKKDILKSMRANAICDKCRKQILNENYSISEHQLYAINTLLTKAGSLLNESEEKTITGKRKIFIGSSTEGLDVARKIKAALKYDAHVDTWADGLI